jgi:outer membrane receptor for ferrienterochelin and colicin
LLRKGWDNSASPRPELCRKQPAAIDVITAEDIERSGVTNIPDALRLGTEMQVAQIEDRPLSITGLRIAIKKAASCNLFLRRRREAA